MYMRSQTVFDATWFGLPRVELVGKLREQLVHKADRYPKLAIATKGYIDFLEAGGRVKLADLTGKLLRRYLTRGIPVLTGLSSTWLYRTSRELDDTTHDDLRGEPSGHFVVLYGYDRETREVWVADPYAGNPFDGEARLYPVKIERLIASVLLGVVSYDCSLLVIEPHTDKQA